MNGILWRPCFILDLIHRDVTVSNNHVVPIALTSCVVLAIESFDIGMIAKVPVDREMGGDFDRIVLFVGCKILLQPFRASANCVVVVIGFVISVSFVEATNQLIVI